MVNQKNEHKIPKCVKCGGEIARRYKYPNDEEELVAKCHTCGKESDLHTSEYYLYFSSDYSSDVQKPLFETGLKGIINGKLHSIVGRIRYQNEDAMELSILDIWLALTENGKYHYFFEEEGDLSLYEDFPNDSISIDEKNRAVYFDDTKLSKMQITKFRIVEKDGVQISKAEIGSLSVFYRLKKRDQTFQISLSEGKINAKIKDKTSFGDLIYAFRGKEYIENYSKIFKKRIQYRKKAVFYIAATAITLLIAVYNFISVTPVSDIFINVKIFDNNRRVVYNKGTGYLSNFLYGPFVIPDEKSLYEIKISIIENTQPFIQQWKSYKLYLIKESRLKRKTENNMSYTRLAGTLKLIDFYKEPLESCMMKGCLWDHRNEVNGKKRMSRKLKSKSDYVIDRSGRYYLYLDFFSNKKNNSKSFRAEINKIHSSRYYLVLTLVFLILFWLNFFRSKNYKNLPD